MLAASAPVGNRTPVGGRTLVGEGLEDLFDRLARREIDCWPGALGVDFGGDRDEVLTILAWLSGRSRIGEMSVNEHFSVYKNSATIQRATRCRKSSSNAEYNPSLRRWLISSADRQGCYRPRVS